MRRCVHETERLEIVGAYNVLTIPALAVNRRCLRRNGHEGPHVIQRHDLSFVLWVTDMCGQEISGEIASQYIFGDEG